MYVIINMSRTLKKNTWTGVRNRLSENWYQVTKFITNYKLLLSTIMSYSLFCKCFYGKHNLATRILLCGAQFSKYMKETSEKRTFQRFCSLKAFQKKRKEPPKTMFTLSYQKERWEYLDTLRTRSRRPSKNPLNIPKSNFLREEHSTKKSHNTCHGTAHAHD